MLHIVKFSSHDIKAKDKKLHKIQSQRQQLLECGNVSFPEILQVKEWYEFIHLFNSLADHEKMLLCSIALTLIKTIENK
jgi:hypothetical protein